MHTFTVSIKDEALSKKVLWLLQHFEKDGLEIISNEDLEDIKLLSATRSDDSIQFDEYLKNANKY